MYFKITKRNPYRDLLRNAMKISRSDISFEEKATEYKNLYHLLASRLHENEALLTNQAAFGKRCEHWGQIDITSIKKVTNKKNPWLSLKHAMRDNNHNPDAISAELGWFKNSQFTEDWIVD